MLEEQVEVCLVQTVVSRVGMGVVHIFPRIHSSAEEHGNEHSLPRPEVRHVNALKEMTQVVIMQDLVIEEGSRSLDSLPSPDQLKQVFNHDFLTAKMSVIDFSTVKSGLAALLAFIAVNNDADDMTPLVDVGVRNRCETQVTTLYIGAVHLIKSMPDLRGAKDVAGR